MHIKYQLKEYYIPFDRYIKFNILKYHLKLKRFLRLAKRLVLYTKHIIPIIVCVIIFEAVVIPTGLSLGVYKSWKCGIWDLRTFFLTSVLITLVLKVYTLECERHKSLLNQYSVYNTFKFESEVFIQSLCKIVNFEWNFDMFFTDADFRNYYEELQKKMKSDFPEMQNKVIIDDYLLYSTKKIPREIVIEIYFEQYYRELNNVKSALYAENFIGPINHAKEQINDICNELKAEQCIIKKQADNYTDIQLLRFIDCISRCIFPAVKDLRHPWRWDFNIDEEIRQIISQSEEMICKR